VSATSSSTYDLETQTAVQKLIGKKGGLISVGLITAQAVAQNSNVFHEDILGVINLVYGAHSSGRPSWRLVYRREKR
jgi:hypothetical protein